MARLLPTDLPFSHMSNVWILPRNVAASDGYIARGVELFLHNLANDLAGGAMVNPITPAV